MPRLNIQNLLASGARLMEQRRLPEAEKVYRQILEKDPRNPDAVHCMGLIAHHAGRHEMAADILRHALLLKPDNPEALANLGIVLCAAGKTSEAVAASKRACELTPHLAKAHFNLGVSLRANGQLDEAIKAYRNAVTLDPNYSAAYRNLGSALGSRGLVDEAIAAFSRVLELIPGDGDAYYNLGVAFQKKQDLDAAAEAYRKSVAANPANALAQNNLGNVLKDRCEFDAALQAYEQALIANPSFAEVANNIALVWKDKRDIDRCIASYRRSLAINPNLPEPHSGMVMAMQHHTGFDARAISDEFRIWNQRHALPLQSLIKPHENDRDPNRRLKIGYVSPDFRDHVVARNILPLFHRHDREQFDITCYAHVHFPDSVTTEFKNLANCWRDTLSMNHDQLANQIRLDKIDILVDLAQHTAHNRLLTFARKPAPVQVAFAGYPGSTGLTAIDYRLSDPYLDPPEMDDSIYSEKTIRLPDSFWCYDPLECADITVNSLPAIENGFVTFGCLNNFSKITDFILSVWAELLHRVERSRLLLLSVPGAHQAMTLDYLAKEGIDRDRVEFLSRGNRRGYLEQYHRIDIGLDSFPYNGHTTSLDSFWMGVPVVTLVGETSVSRAGLCQLSNLGMQELAAKTPEEFLEIASDLARDVPRLREIRSTLRQRMEQSPLMDAPKWTRGIEDAYRQMWRAWCEKA